MVDIVISRAAAREARVQHHEVELDGSQWRPQCRILTKRPREQIAAVHRAAPCDARGRLPRRVTNLDLFQVERDRLLQL
eukprot:853843-Amphidinium_carterae.1